MNRDLCIIITARMASERLPGKALVDVRGQPLIYWIVRRLQAVGKVVLACVQDSQTTRWRLMWRRWTCRFTAARRGR